MKISHLTVLFLAVCFSCNAIAETNPPTQTMPEISLLASTPQANNVSKVLIAQKAKQPQPIGNNVTTFLQSLTPQERTALGDKLKQEEAVEDNPYTLLLYQRTFIMPGYYTSSPDSAIYSGNTPDGQSVMSLEFKGQISVQVPIIRDLWSPKNSLNAAYTQLSYWQVYAQSQYFRETDYEPEIFFRHDSNQFFTWKAGAFHQSNGRGGEDERSWNRAYLEGIYSRGNWIFSVQPWWLIFKDESSDIHNPDITDYLGNGQISFSVKLGKSVLSVMSRNELESSFSRGTEEIDFSFPLHGHFNAFVQLFSGYGQSLIEYNHYTNGVGLGITFNNGL